MSVWETLVAARKLITPKKRWIQHVMARSAKGREVIPNSKAAVCWCLNGAILKVNPDFFNWSALVPGTHMTQHWRFNDTHTHAEVLAALDEAISAATS